MAIPRVFADARQVWRGDLDKRAVDGVPWSPILCAVNAMLAKNRKPRLPLPFCLMAEGFFVFQGGYPQKGRFAVIS